MKKPYAIRSNHFNKTVIKIRINGECLSGNSLNLNVTKKSLKELIISKRIRKSAIVSRAIFVKEKTNK